MVKKAARARMRILKTGTSSKEISKFKNNTPLYPPLMRGELKGGAGFTLIELIVVVFILSLVIGIVAPSFYDLGIGRLKSDAGKIASILRYLNDSAIARKETLPLTFDLDDKTLKWNTSEGDRMEKFDDLYSLSATSTGSLSTGEVTLFFSPLGLQESLSITLKDSDKELAVISLSITLKDSDKELAVMFNPLSGRVKVIQNEKIKAQ
ncbi:MAG: prepilin-type N-terminal cleavage/methylation domain-containing protein [Nitrospirae bacterium]|nr:prepilin-type N-terminal cleavage/methylation domain-containing protein [Nitrospirota bacterium]